MTGFEIEGVEVDDQDAPGGGRACPTAGGLLGGNDGQGMPIGGKGEPAHALAGVKIESFNTGESVLVVVMVGRTAGVDVEQPEVEAPEQELVAHGLEADEVAQAGQVNGVDEFEADHVDDVEPVSATNVAAGEVVAEGDGVDFVAGQGVMVEVVAAVGPANEFDGGGFLVLAHEGDATAGENSPHVGFWR